MNTIWFDMDGTLFDLYGVDNWLEKLRSYDSSPYKEASPLLSFSHFARIVNKLQKCGYRIGIISWLSRESTPEYDEDVTIAKRCCLQKRLPSVDWDYIHILPYGTCKSEFAKKDDILFDDEMHNRMKWSEAGGVALDEKNIIATLKILLDIVRTM